MTKKLFSKKIHNNCLTFALTKYAHCAKTDIIIYTCL